MAGCKQLAARAQARQGSWTDPGRSSTTYLRRSAVWTKETMMRDLERAPTRIVVSNAPQLGP